MYRFSSEAANARLVQIHLSLLLKKILHRHWDLLPTCTWWENFESEIVLLVCRVKRMLKNVLGWSKYKVCVYKVDGGGRMLYRSPARCVQVWNLGCDLVISLACYEFTVQFLHCLLAQVGGCNCTHVQSGIICTFAVEPTSNSTSLHLGPLWMQLFLVCCNNSHWVATTASQVQAEITSPRSSPLAALFSSNLLLTEWLADKWRLLFLARGLHRVWQRRRRTLQRNVWKLLLAPLSEPAAASCTIYTQVSRSFHLRKGEKTEFALKSGM